MSVFPRKILLTGATGFIGKHVAQRLLSDGCEVSAIILPGDSSTITADIKGISVNMADAEKLTAAVRTASPELIIHMAAAGVTDLTLTFQESCHINVQGVINILEAAHLIPSLQRLILFGSSYEYGARRSDDGMDPFSAYGASKLAAWSYARTAYNMWGLPVVWVRPFQVYGPGQPETTFIPSAIRAAISGQDFRMTAGAQQRDFIYVSDIVSGLEAVIAAADIDGRSLVLGTGTLTPLIRVVQSIWQMTNARGRILAGALPYRSGEVSAIAANIHRTRLLANWEAAVPLERGLELTIDAIRESFQE
jgi:UDP-glucose 4-epimerase